jgi:hypothetical protein
MEETNPVTKGAPREEDTNKKPKTAEKDMVTKS